ncbi:hypothetical protein ACFWIB_40170 [Streptomyces sp. NPDC127051]|uniref:hypothetical protein n=1 Tax=Streptomyces sp. NPDC127051 TaxID=3347119 RepID=UPI0036493AAC
MGVAAPAGSEDAHAAALREWRIQVVPAPLRPAVRAFADALTAQRQNAERLGLRPNQLKTIEIRLDTVRDLALHLHVQGHTTWASVNVTDLEAFLACNPARRASWLAETCTSLAVSLGVRQVAGRERESAF